MATHIGQYQSFNNPSPIRDNVVIIKDVKIANNKNSKYTEIGYQLNSGNFLSTVSYYFSGELQLNDSYEFTLTIYLTSSTLSNMYKFIKEIKIPQAENSDRIDEIAYFVPPEGLGLSTSSSFDGTDCISFVESVDSLPVSSPINNKIYRLGTEYFLYHNTNYYNQNGIVSDFSASVGLTSITTSLFYDSWTKSEETSTYSLNFGFGVNANETSFDTIVFQIERQSIDAKINSGSGRTLVFNSSNLNVLNNIFSGINPTTIGIWGRPGLPVIIDGNELKIGPNSILEINNYTINTLGVYAPDHNGNDIFTIDYQY